MGCGETYCYQSIITDSPQSFLPETLKIISGGSMPSARDTFLANYKLAELRRKADKIWDNFDFIALPTTGTIFTKEAIFKDPIELNSKLGRYTNFMNLLDLCGCAVPTAFREDGLPAGLTLFAPAFHDREVLRWAGKFNECSTSRLQTDFEPKSCFQSEQEETIDLCLWFAHVRTSPQ